MQFLSTDIKPIKFDQIKETYIFYLKENFILMSQIKRRGDNNFAAFDPNKSEKLFKGRALHIQLMSLIGITAEHLVKLIISKRGYTLNKISYVKDDANSSMPTIIYSSMLIGFKESVKLLTQSNTNNYFIKLKPYQLNPFPKAYDRDVYFNRKKINPGECLNLLVEVRNSYLHDPTPKNEQNGVIWYLYDFILWLAKKEFSGEFKNQKYIGNDEIKKIYSA